MKPSIGRIVHYVDSSGNILPAIITAVHTDTCVNLTIFMNNAWEGPTTEFKSSVCEGKSPYNWHWPERVN